MKIGITGGIASGKSTVTAYLISKGWQVIDADVIARQVVEPHTQGLNAVVDHFSTAVLTDQGTLNRKKLGQIIFEDSIKRQELDNILQPLIQKEMARQIKEAEKQQSVVFVDIPLLFEMDYETWFDEVWVVYIPKKIQVERLMKRNGFPKEQALNRIESQMPLEEKKKLATRVLDNTAEKEALYCQVDKQLNEMLGGDANGVSKMSP